MTGQGLKLLYLGAGLLLVIMGLGNAFIQQQSLRDYYTSYEERYYSARAQGGILKTNNQIGIELNDSNDLEEKRAFIMHEKALTGLFMGTVIEGRGLRIQIEDDTVFIKSMREFEEWMGTFRGKVGIEDPQREYTVTINLRIDEDTKASDFNMLEITILKWRDTHGK